MSTANRISGTGGEGYSQAGAVATLRVRDPPDASTILPLFDALCAATASSAHHGSAARVCTVRAEAGGPRPSPIEPRLCPASCHLHIRLAYMGPVPAASPWRDPSTPLWPIQATHAWLWSSLEAKSWLPLPRVPRCTACRPSCVLLLTLSPFPALPIPLPGPCPRRRVAHLPTRRVAPLARRR